MITTLSPIDVEFTVPAGRRAAHRRPPGPRQCAGRGAGPHPRPDPGPRQLLDPGQSGRHWHGHGEGQGPLPQRQRRAVPQPVRQCPHGAGHHQGRDRRPRHRRAPEQRRLFRVAAEPATRPSARPR
ncbi:hypothetical protein ACRAWD_21400 [Caulobacter segnis]